MSLTKSQLERLDPFTLAHMPNDAIAELKNAREAIARYSSFYAGQIHQRWEYVRQLDGTIKHELVPTMDKEIYDRSLCELARIDAFLKKLEETG